MKTYFYYLRDPRDNQIKYIGQSKNPSVRYNAHINQSKQGKDANSRKVRWIMCLIEKDLKPVMEVFEEYFGNVENAHKREWQLIQEHLDTGYDLTNGNDGGVPYLLPDERVKPVYQYEKSTGIFIAGYRCAFDAFASTGVKDANLSTACKNEGIKPKFPGGFIWSYNKYETYPLDSIPEKKQTNKPIKLSKDGVDNIYRSAREAALALDLDFRQISDCARGKQKTVKGYICSFAMI